MTIGTCDAVRDLLPDLLYGRLPPEDARVVRLHLDSCASCRHEAALIGVLRESERVPAGLEQRIVAATAARRGGWRPGWGRATLAAAALGAALLGGQALLRRSPPAVQPPAAPPPGPTATARPMEGRSLMLAPPGAEAWPDASATLDDLTAEELTTLLKELQS